MRLVGTWEGCCVRPIVASGANEDASEGGDWCVGRCRQWGEPWNDWQGRNVLGS